MADIDVVPKHRSGHMWLWIIIAIIAVVIIAMMFMRGSSQPQTGRFTAPRPAAPAISAPAPHAAAAVRVA